MIANYIRCIKSNIKCDGYAPPKIKLFEPTSTSSISSTSLAPLINQPPDNLQLQSYLTTYPHSQELALNPTFGTEEEYRSFQFFLEKTADLISIYSQPYLWTVLLPQATWHQPAIKHSIIALANLHQSLTTTGTISIQANHSFISHYNNAIRALLTDKPPVDVVLTSCVIFWALENFNGSGQAAVDHMKAAIKILGEWKAKGRPNDPAHDLITTYIEPTIKDGIKLVSVDRAQELEHLITALSLSPQDMRILRYKCPAFDTLDVATAYLSHCMQKILHLLYAPHSAEVVESIHDIEARLCKWMNLFQKLTATGVVYHRRMLVVHNVVAHTLLDRLKKQAAVPIEEVHPTRCRFTYVVLEIEDMLKHNALATAAHWASRPLSNIFIPPVFLVATCALKLENRRRAIHQLRLLNLAEGLWNTELAAKIAEAMLDIVDQFSIPAQEVEMRHMDFGIGQDGSTLHMRWEPDSEQFQNVAFSREIDLGAMPQADLQNLPEVIKHFGYRFTWP
ncbi:hypothetical protein LTR10_020115 [Elasticomyces elasticus]|uniref:Uncharacterized protein n=1 Tax=Exophiala sideris TaxID=1016849 RepID=A0ABR0IVS5_9EURO|nr:hypothetical protein LTR10_020115 [Elasticomyces elasticus]KAK5021576.1 hypothetical protein LTS07_010873 [Exophiala sideris]KAK5024792.1 hypothetical protein LTR13_010761 [Exophiala sideris]KAK5049713.1 hypothetical protein LTR69_010897 [Exophiala sideris]KAK5176694.1 hypothetical protein LTR44_010764 [Eurotiomycetes sp. CCFEE 6388]